MDNQKVLKYVLVIIGISIISYAVYNNFKTVENETQDEKDKRQKPTGAFVMLGVFFIVAAAV